ncbi:hypothetical protein KR009_001011 [Drosophila setifemur]|nr:hypothetical protein KR009_001011 [Drosophila setifemur]
MEKHVAARGFCLCHLIFVWYHTGKIGLYLGYYNVGYEERLKRFKCDEQIYVHLMTVVHLMTSLMYLCLSQRWIEDKFACLLYVPLYVYFIMLRNHVTELLNQCAGIHKSLQRIMGNRFCVELRRECIYALLLNVVFLLVIIWKVRIYSGYQTAFIAGVSFIYYLELLFFGNYLIWLGCIYRSMNEFVSQHMRSDRLDILKGVLKQQTTIWRVHRNVSRYFGLHILSLMIQPGVEILKNIHEVNVEIIPLILNLINLALLLLIALNLQKKYAKFQRSYLKLGDDPNYFVLKSWRLLQHRTLPQAFGITLMRKREKLKYKQDIVTMMYSNNFPAVQLVKSSLIITSFAFKNLEIPLTLSMLRTCLKSHLRELLTLLVLRLLFNKNINLEYEHESQQDNFNDNVTQTISQVYRFYFYDEFE